MTRRFMTGVAGLLLLLAVFAAGWASAKMRVGSAVARASLSERERRFADLLTGATLAGHFTIAGREDRGQQVERYDISSAEKVGETEWRFTAHLKYASVDVTLPIVIPVEWAGDTPVMTLTGLSVPALGAPVGVRLVFYGDEYAGVWTHGKARGQMFGRVERTAGVAEKPNP